MASNYLNPGLQIMFILMYVYYLVIDFLFGGIINSYVD
jgi:hypothetical protein